MLHASGLVFLRKLLKKFSQEKNEEGRKNVKYAVNDG